MERSALRKRIKYGLIALFSICILILIVYEFRNISSGPIIEVESPQNMATFKESSITVSGTIKNAIQTSLNDLPIFISPQGKFNEKIILSQGINFIKIYAKDKFNKEKTVILEVVNAE